MYLIIRSIKNINEFIERIAVVALASVMHNKYCNFQLVRKHFQHREFFVV